MTDLQSHSGPKVATVFHRLLAVVFLLAWTSLLWQIDVLIGSRGLIPIADLAAKPVHPSFLEFPTILLWFPNDIALHVGIWLGLCLGLASFAGIAPRFCTLASTLLYLSYATAARDFLHFQWDNMLIECGVLAALLSRDHPARWVHFLFRVLLFKLYFESGIAKWQSYLGDWHDGSAMTFYYETAPIPTWLAWYAHSLPDWWHRLESRLVLGVELFIPFLIFGTRAMRIAALIALTGFQALNIATANYGFFCYLSLALHVFLLDEADVPGKSSLGARRIPNISVRALRGGAAAIVVVTYIGISVLEAVHTFGAPGEQPAFVATLRRAYRPWRLINTYHLFGHITRQRIEPELQTFDGTRWQTRDLLYKPGPLARRPPIVAPHQPRVDFRLWFYGLGYQRGTPVYVQKLVERICTDPAAVQTLFADELPEKPEAVRLVFWDYRFTRSRENPFWWKRQLLAETRPLSCASFGSA